MDQSATAFAVGLPAIALLSLIAARALVPERPQFRLISGLTRLVREDRGFDWSIHILTGLLVLSVLLVTIGPATNLPQWFEGAFVGAVAAAIAYSVARPPAGDEGPANPADARTLVISLATHLILGAALSEVLMD